MADVAIDKLTLDVPGLTEESGQRLGALIAQKLGEARWMPTQGADKTKVAVTAPAGGAGLDALANAIVAELKRQMG
jgi:hypothetical protein